MGLSPVLELGKSSYSRYRVITLIDFFVDYEVQLSNLETDDGHSS